MDTSRYYGFAAVLGMCALVLGLLPLSLKASLGWVSLVIAVLAAVVAFMAGRSAKAAGAKPVKAGALVGLAYSVLADIGVLFAPHLTRADLLKRLQSAHRTVPSGASLNTALSVANSPTLHVVFFVVGVAVAVVVGLLIALVGGATAKAPGQAGAV